MNGYDPTAAHVPDMADVGQEVTLDEIAAYHAEARSAGAAPCAKERVEDAIAIPVAPTSIPAIPPVVLRKRRVSGRYQADSGAWRLELRVDVDGIRPMQRVSGDFFQLSGGTVAYFGSFVAKTIAVNVTATNVTITGTVDTTWNATFKNLRVTIPRVAYFAPAGPATIQWSNAGGAPGVTYICPFASQYFRSVDLEQDRENNVQPFSSYDTGLLPSGGPARTLTVAAAYAEAGIEMRSAGVPNIVGAAPGGTWSNAELHNAMVTNFALWKEVPQWKVWLFHAMKHDLGAGLLGIMFDQQGRQRQGCAVFYQAIGGAIPTNQRDQLYCCVHELGHCFNLYHSFHKQYMTPPMPNRPWSLSWMNYPQNYQPLSGPGGAAAFWAAFAFQFDDLETLHLRHAFRDNVIMGGNPFGTGAALKEFAGFNEPVEDRSGLCLELRADRVFQLGEPVVVEIKLSTAAGTGQRVHRHLHPDASFVRLAIQKPGGAVIVHEPVMEQCVAVETVDLTTERPAIFDSAYVGYGKQGLTFEQPGVYGVRAVYAALDGSPVVSNTLKVRVRAPLSEADDKVADLLMGDEQGLLFYLLGSDSDHLAAGNAALQEIAEKYTAHPLAVYARLVSGYAAARPFKKVEANRAVTQRDPKPVDAAKLLGAVIAASEKGRGLDNISLGQIMCRLARTQKLAGESKAAGNTIKQMVSLFKAKGLKPFVLQEIETQGNAALRSEA
jgi:hypothetical protein